MGHSPERSVSAVTMTSSQVDDELAWLCDEVVNATGVSCCGVMMATPGGQGLTAHASDGRAKAVEDLQHTLGEGPGVDASYAGAAVLVPDLGDASNPRWPTFSREARGIGIYAAFAFPLLLGASSLGALSLYRAHAGGLTSEHLTRGQVAADAVAHRLAHQSEQLSDGITQVDPMQVHQAAGMAMVQLGVPIDQALLRLRAIAFSEGKTVDQFADAIVHRRRRLSKEDR